MNWSKGARKLRHASKYLADREGRETVEMLLKSVVAEPRHDPLFHGIAQIGLWFLRIFAALVWRWRLKRAKIDPNAKCPSCGACDGDIRFDQNIAWPDGARGAVLHHCKVDQAIWAEKPIVKAEAWRVDGYQEQQDQRSDAPVILKPQAVTSAEARKRSQPAFKSG